MGIAFVLLVALVPAAILLAVFVLTLRTDADFRRRRPFVFLAGLGFPLAAAALATLIAATFVLGNSADPANAYRSIFGVDAEPCTTLLRGETTLINDAESAELSFRSTCPGMAARIDSFGLAIDADPQNASELLDATTFMPPDLGCISPMVRTGRYARWHRLSIVQCEGGLYYIFARWVD